MKLVYAVISCSIFLLLSSCVYFKAAKPQYTLAPELDGYWRTDGYSMILNIRKGKIKFYEVTSVSSIEHIPYFAKYRSLKLKPINNRKIIGYIEGNAFKYYASRIHKLPFDNGLSSLFGLLPYYRKNDPENNFEVFWHTFRENYPFFKLKGVNWLKVYAQYRPMVTSHTQEDELYEIFLKMTKPLKDPNVWIKKEPFAPVLWDESMLPEWLSKTHMDETQNAISQLAAMGELKDGILSQTYENILLKDFIPVIKNVYLGGSYHTVCNGNIFYGRLNPFIGYIFIGRNEHYLSDHQKDEPEAGCVILNDALDHMTAYFANTRNLIIDNRFHMGGLNAYNLEIIRRFSKEKTFVGYKETKDIHPFASKQGYYVHSKGVRPFQVDQLYILNSRLTHNAGEAMTAMMKTLPFVKIIGEKSFGALSGELIRHLPNGWEFSLSNEQFHNADGIRFDGVGITPDIEKEMNLKAFKSSKDSILEEAILQIENNL